MLYLDERAESEHNRSLQQLQNIDKALWWHVDDLRLQTVRVA